MLRESGTLQSSAEEGRGLEDIALKKRSPAEDRSRQTLPLCGPKSAQTHGDGPQEGRSVCNGAEFGSGRWRVLETDEGMTAEQCKCARGPWTAHRIPAGWETPVCRSCCNRATLLRDEQ